MSINMFPRIITILLFVSLVASEPAWWSNKDLRKFDTICIKSTRKVLRAKKIFVSDDDKGEFWTNDAVSVSSIWTETIETHGQAKEKGIYRCYFNINGDKTNFFQFSDLCTNCFHSKKEVDGKLKNVLKCEEDFTFGAGIHVLNPGFEDAEVSKWFVPFSSTWDEIDKSVGWFDTVISIIMGLIDVGTLGLIAIDLGTVSLTSAALMQLISHTLISSLEKTGLRELLADLATIATINTVRLNLHAIFRCFKDNKPEDAVGDGNHKVAIENLLKIKDKFMESIEKNKEAIDSFIKLKNLWEKITDLIETKKVTNEKDKTKMDKIRDLETKVGLKPDDIGEITKCMHELDGI